MKKDSLGQAGGDVPPHPPSAPDFIYENVRDLILGGEVRAGQKLHQDEIAKRFGFSRVPVREALRQLERDGLVVLRPNRGYVVATFDPDQIQEIFDILMLLEQQAAYFGTRKRTDEDVAKVEDLLTRMGEVAATGEEGLIAFASLNQSFHLAIAQPGGRPQLLQLTTMLRNKVEPYVRVGSRVAGRMDTVMREHQLIFAAYKAGDADAAASISQLHIQHVCERLVLFLRQERQGA